MSASELSAAASGVVALGARPSNTWVDTWYREARARLTQQQQQLQQLEKQEQEQELETKMAADVRSSSSSGSPQAYCLDMAVVGALTAAAAGVCALDVVGSHCTRGGLVP